MKSLNLTKPLAMLVIGIPGAGKSFFAKRFSETFGAPLVSYDCMRYEIFQHSSFSPEEATILHKLADYQIEELTKTGRSFLVDGGCNAKADRQRISHIVKKAGYDVLIIWVQTHQGTAQTRALKRNPRREDDLYNQSLTPEEFATQSRRLTAPNRENYVVISGMHTYSTQAKAVLRKLVAHREAEADAAHKSENHILHHNSRNIGRRNVIIR